MSLSKEQAIAIGEKVLKDIEFWDSDMETPSALYFENGDISLLGEDIPTWMVSFPYGAEDFGPGNAHMMIAINDQDEIAGNISMRNGYVNLGYDADADKYSKVD